MKSAEFYRTTAWKWFSRYVILHYSDGNGNVKCATSGLWYRCNDKNLHLGHWIKVFEGGGKTNFNTAFDERNVMPQSHSENVYKGGNQIAMMEAIIKIHGQKAIDKLLIKRKHPFKLDKYTLSEISDHYKEKFNNLSKIKGNPWKK